ncbi:MAG: 16S rRNA (adenine(1518)-N(6)/adenine(1519)-N(6))-dimethyltransferase RsmA [Rhodospirillales bacterium]|nr:16S rRNA (adenine(1518)-N(6)/adenine(1519)-N(6))-dimethyltransferase RsmA [Rhodospirillales bacterium]
MTAQWDNLPPLRDVIARHNLRAEKKLGQNFLLDANITDKIARSAGDLSDKTVFEIGPGPGGLTRSLLKAGAKKVIAIEYDPRAIAALQDLVAAAGGQLTVIHGDALKTDLLSLAPDGPRAIVANLPYNIATPLLIGWLRQTHGGRAYDSMTLMFQKEVVQRICAVPGGRDYGRLSVLSQWLCDCRKVFDLPPGAFTPPPKVTSSIVQLIPKTLSNDQPDFQTIEKLTAAAFGQRRKMLRSTLKEYLPVLEQAGIDPTNRAEQITVDQFINLAMMLT